jgi:threonine/homoserine/homoserine lactone efflux protein
MSEAQLVLFVVTSLVVIVTPGQDMILVMSLVKGPAGYFAGALSAWLRARPRVLVGMHRTSGAILIALGLRLAFERRA